MDFGDQDTVLLVGSALFVLELLLLIVPVFRRVKSRRFDAFEIGVLFAVLYCLYSIPLGLQKLYFEAGYQGWAPALYFLVTTLGLASFWLGYNSALGLRIGMSVPVFSSVNNVGIAISTATFAAIGLLLVVLLVQGMGGISSYLAIGYGGALYIAEAGKGYLQEGWDFLVLSLALLWLYSTRTKSVLSRVLFFLAGIPFLWLKIKMGDRGTILALMIMLLAQQHYLVKRFSRKKSVALLFAGYTAGVLFGMSRFWIVREDLSSVPQEIVRNFELQYLVPSNVGEFTAPAESLYNLVEHRQFFEYQYGHSYTIFFRNFFPQAWDSERAPTLGEWYVKKFKPTIADRGGGVGFFTAGEAFANFGFVGPFLQFFVYGILLRVTYVWFRKQPLNAAAVLLYSLFLVWVFPLIRIDLATALRGALIRGIVPALIACEIMVLNKINTSTANDVPLKRVDRLRHSWLPLKPL